MEDDDARLLDGGEGARAGASKPAKGWRTWFQPPAGAELSTRTVAAHGIGGFVVGFMSDVTGIFINPFLLEVPRMDPLLAGNMLLVAKLVDAVTDPIIGTASDATRNSFGRRRPWMLAALPIAVTFNMLLWQHWPQLDGNGGAQFAYYLCMFCLATFGMTCYYIPCAALTVTISTKDIDRVRLVTARSSYVLVGTIIGVLTIGLTVNSYPVGSEGPAYMIAAGINTALVAIAILVSVFGVHEPSSLTMPLRTFSEELKRFLFGIADLTRSWTYMCLALMASLGWMGMYFVQNNLVLFATYSANLSSVYIIMLLVALCSCTVFVPLTYWLLKRISKRLLMALGSVWIISTWFGLLFFPPGSLAVAIVLSILSGGGLTITGLMPWVMLADVIDQDELTHGKRREGLMSAFFVSLNKVSNGIALALSGIILSAGGYDNQNGQNPPPTEELDWTLRLLCGLIPICCVACILPLVYFYPLTASAQRKLNEELVEKRRQLLPNPAKADASASADVGPLPSKSDVSFGRGLILHADD